MPSIFTRIINREIPSYTIYEDDKLYAFLTIEPFTLGHTLVVPKEEIGDVLNISDDLMTHLSTVAKNIVGPAIKRATNCVRVGFLIEGFGVSDHMHLHLIPLNTAGDMYPQKAHKESPENMMAIADKIRGEIGNAS